MMLDYDELSCAVVAIMWPDVWLCVRWGRSASNSFHSKTCAPDAQHCRDHENAPFRCGSGCTRNQTRTTKTALPLNPKHLTVDPGHTYPETWTPRPCSLGHRWPSQASKKCSPLQAVTELCCYLQIPRKLKIPMKSPTSFL